MKIILVTSNLTYVPQNYDDVLENILNAREKDIAGIILIKLNPLNITGRIIYLYLTGCTNIAKVMLKNLASLLVGEKIAIMKKYGKPFIKTRNVNNPTTISWIRRIEPDIIINMRARCIFKNEVLKIPRLACINVHHGILPCQRGIFCDLYAIEKNIDTGFTIHKMTEKIDQGRIFCKEKVSPNRNYMSYLKKVSRQESMAIIKFIKNTAQVNLLPEGNMASCDEPTITTTPNYGTIKRLQRNKIIL